jgi:hypothetical protein
MKSLVSKRMVPQITRVNRYTLVGSTPEEPDNAGVRLSSSLVKAAS